MLGNPLKREETIIIGAGIAGLSIGYFLKKAGIPIQIYEKENRAGGLLGSHNCKNGLAEQAANGFLWSDAIAEICKDLGLEILPPLAEQKARYLVRNNKMTRMPLSPLELIKVMGKAVMPHKESPKTIRNFGEIYFGETFTDYILEPALLGIYGGKSNELGFEAILGKMKPFVEGNQSLVLAGLKHGFKKDDKNPARKEKKPKGSQSFKGGMQELVDALSEHLAPEISYNSAPSQNDLAQKQCIICTPAYAASSYLHNELGNLLNQVHYNPMISVTCFVEKQQVPKFKPGFGCLISQKEGYEILGVLFNSCIFENRVNKDNWLSLTAILRDFDGTLFPKEDQEIFDIVEKDLRRLLDLQESPEEKKIFRWKKGIPLYSPQLQESWQPITEMLKTHHPNIRLFGNYTGQISIRGMADEACRIANIEQGILNMDF